MQSFSYVKARNQSDVLSALSVSADTAVIAGGTDLLDLMKLGIRNPSRVIDINGIGLDVITITPGGARIGALSRLSDVATNAQIAKLFPLISQSILASASGQIRNMATIGGNLLQRTRCPYFREIAFACNKREPGAGCSATAGFNRGSAILGASASCVAVHPSDLAVALVALNASVTIASSEGRSRSMPLEQFYLLPGDTPHIDTTLRPGELIVGVDVPKSAAAALSLYLKVRDRASFEFALVSVAAAIELDGKTIRAARIALGGVAPRPWRSPAAEEAIVGKPATAKTFALAADALLDGAKPLSFNGFKVQLARNAICRALGTLASRS